MAEQKTLYLIAGPNGAGKSTFTQRGQIKAPVVDPDAIARRINPNNPQQAAVAAGRQAAKEVQEHLKAGRSFARETTLAGKSGLRLINQAKAAGYRVELHYVGIDNWKRSRARIDERVQNGGHNVPTEDLKRRFTRSFENLKEAIKKVDAGKLYDSTKRYRRTVAEIDKGQVKSTIKNPPQWAQQVGAKAEATAAQKAAKVSQAAAAAVKSIKDPALRARAEQLAGQIAGKAKQLDKTKRAKTAAKRDRGQDFER